MIDQSSITTEYGCKEFIFSPLTDWDNGHNIFPELQLNDFNFFFLQVATRRVLKMYSSSKWHRLYRIEFDGNIKVARRKNVI